MAEKEGKRARPGPPVWNSMNDVPPRLRRVFGARVGVAQRNAIDKRAYDIGFYNMVEGEPGAFIPDRKKAEKEFAAEHEILNGLWVAKKAKKGGAK